MEKMRCKACGHHEHEGHADDCIYTEHHELELRLEEAERKLAELITHLRTLIGRHGTMPPSTAKDINAAIARAEVEVTG